MGENIKKKRDQAIYFFQQMELNSFDRFIYEANFEAFVNSARSITLSMQKENKERYDKIIFPKINGDLLMSFFNEVRTFSFHEGDSKINIMNEGLHMRHMLSFDGKGGCLARIRSRNGVFVKEIQIKSDPNAEIFLGGIGIAIDSGLFEKAYYFNKIERFPLDNIEIINVTDFCYQYLEKLLSIVSIYMDTK